LLYNAVHRSIVIPVLDRVKRAADDPRPDPTRPRRIRAGRVGSGYGRLKGRLHHVNIERSECFVTEVWRKLLAVWRG